MRLLIQLLSAGLLLVTTQGLAQHTNGDSSLYARSIVCIVRGEQTNRKEFKERGGRSVTLGNDVEDHLQFLQEGELDTLFVEMYDWMENEKLPVLVDSVVIKYISTNKQVRQRAKKGFWICRVWPLKTENQGLAISFTDYAVTIKKHRRLMYGLSGGTKIRFNYDCEKHAYVVIEVKKWGI